jgi:intracellular sulfur oxidation DsrE/DsrF family protein
MHRNLIILVLMVFSLSGMADELSPWGHATTSQQTYEKQKVLYDITTGDAERLANILARTGYLSKLNGENSFDSKIIVVIHGDAIPFFAIANFKQRKKLMELAYSQTLNEVIEFRMCQKSAELQGFKPADMHGFVSMVPMADAEIIRLQQEGYAYMR